MNSHTKTDNSEWLLVDDTRNEPVDTIARDFRAGARALKANAYGGLMIDYQLDLTGREPTGLDLLEWAGLRELLPPRIFVVSTHPTGRERIIAFLKQNGYVEQRQKLDIGEVILPFYWEKEAFPS